MRVLSLLVFLDSTCISHDTFNHTSSFYLGDKDAASCDNGTDRQKVSQQVGRDNYFIDIKKEVQCDIMSEFGFMPNALSVQKSIQDVFPLLYR